MATTQDKQHAIDMLRRILEPGDTVVVVLRHRTNTGRLADFFALKPGNSKRLVSHWLGGYIATLYGLRRHKDDLGVYLDDNGIETVAGLAVVLFGDRDALDAELI